jgi:L-fuculose-phosphate aldolase
VDDIVTIDFDGKLVEGDAVPPLEFHAHAAVYRHRPDVNAVVHCHPVWSTLFSMVDKPLQAVTMQAAVLGEIRYFAKIASINNKPLGDEVAAALGDQRVVSLKSHGAVVAAGNVLETFALAYYLEENARRQYLAEQIGTPTTLSAEEVTRIGNTLWKPNLLRKVWEYEYAKLAARRPANDGTAQN